MNAAVVRKELAALARDRLHAVRASQTHGTIETSRLRARFGRATLIALILGLIAFFWWASHFELDQVVRGQGQVMPDSSTQVVQSLEGGIISELPVNQGDRVEKGQVVVRLHDRQFAARLSENNAQRDILLARSVRLRAEAEGGRELGFSEDFRKRCPALVEKEVALFAKRRIDEETKGSFVRAKIDQARAKLNFLKQAIEGGSLSQIERMDLESEIVALTGQIETMRTKFVRDAMEALDLEDSKLSALNESIKADEDRLERTTLRSPVNGVVNAIFVQTEGRVVASGAPIMEIVPEGDSLLVTAKVRPSDIAFLHSGQRVNVRFTAFDFATYGALPGTLETIGVDTIDGEKEEKFYPVRVRTRSDSLGTDRYTGVPLTLRPGMVAEVDILTGRITVLDYLLRPVHRARGLALRER